VAALITTTSRRRIFFSGALLGPMIGERFASDQGPGSILIRAMDCHKVFDIKGVCVFAATASMLLLTVERRLHRR
jgi:hypothetical protein